MPGVLNALGIGFDVNKAKPHLKMSMQRLQLQKNKAEARTKIARREIAGLLDQKKDNKAKIRVEAVIRDDNCVEAYEILEMQCELLAERIRYIESQRDLPSDLDEAVCTLIYAAGRVDVEELKEVRKQFIKKYGAGVEQRADENESNCVNSTVVNKLSVVPPAPRLVQDYLKEIAASYDVEWAPEFDLAKQQLEALKMEEDQRRADEAARAAEAEAAAKEAAAEQYKRMQLQQQQLQQQQLQQQQQQQQYQQQQQQQQPQYNAEPGPQQQQQFYGGTPVLQQFPQGQRPQLFGGSHSQQEHAKQQQQAQYLQHLQAQQFLQQQQQQQQQQQSRLSSSSLSSSQHNVVPTEPSSSDFVLPPTDAGRSDTLQRASSADGTLENTATDSELDASNSNSNTDSNTAVSGSSSGAKMHSKYSDATYDEDPPPYESLLPRHSLPVPLEPQAYTDMDIPAAPGHESESEMKARPQPLNTRVELPLQNDGYGGGNASGRNGSGLFAEPAQAQGDAPAATSATTSAATSAAHDDKPLTALQARFLALNKH